jgi:hypothetical protein
LTTSTQQTPYSELQQLAVLTLVVFACGRIIAQTLGNVGAREIVQMQTAEQRARGHPLYQLELRTSRNAADTAARSPGSRAISLYIKHLILTMSL